MHRDARSLERGRHVAHMRVDEGRDVGYPKPVHHVLLVEPGTIGLFRRRHQASTWQLGDTSTPGLQYLRSVNWGCGRRGRGRLSGLARTLATFALFASSGYVSHRASPSSLAMHPDDPIPPWRTNVFSPLRWRNARLTASKMVSQMYLP